MALCPVRLEVQERRFIDTFMCELPADHAGPHRSMLLTKDLERAWRVEEATTMVWAGGESEGHVSRVPTADVVVIWR